MLKNVYIEKINLHLFDGRKKISDLFPTCLKTTFKEMLSAKAEERVNGKTSTALSYSLDDGIDNMIIENITAEMIDIAAVAISSATCGIIPVPAIKCVAILLLAVLETAKDLDRLQDGFPVELYKGEDDWRFAITGDDLNPTPDDSKTCENGLFYSDYIYLFLYLGFENESSASEMYRRVGDLIQANMRKYTDKNTYMLKNARSYFELNATIRINPLMLALPVSEGFSNNPKDKSDWCTFEIHEIRGYS